MDKHVTLEKSSGDMPLRINLLEAVASFIYILGLIMAIKPA